MKQQSLKAHILLSSIQTKLQQVTVKDVTTSAEKDDKERHDSNVGEGITSKAASFEKTSKTCHSTSVVEQNDLLQITFTLSSNSTDA